MSLKRLLKGEVGGGGVQGWRGYRGGGRPRGDPKKVGCFNQKQRFRLVLEV